MNPSRKTPSAIGNFLRENVTAVKNFAEYLAPGELSSLDDLKPGHGAIVRQGLSQDSGLSRRRSGNLVHALGRLHPYRLPSALEFVRDLLGLPVPRLAFRRRRHRPECAGGFAAGQS